MSSARAFVDEMFARATKERRKTVQDFLDQVTKKSYEARLAREQAAREFVAEMFRRKATGGLV